MHIKMYNFGGQMPIRAHEYDAGADVFPKDSFTIAPHETKKIPLGIGIEVPVGMTACIFPRSSLGSKGITTHLAPIDTGYTGEIHAILYNATDEPITIKEGEKISQMVVRPVIYADFVTDLNDTRGAGGFGSTGK